MQVRVRNLERDADALDRVAGLVDDREAAFAELALDDVLAELLFGAKDFHAGAVSEQTKRVGRASGPACRRRAFA